jgi:hypothetical protein
MPSGSLAIIPKVDSKFIGSMFVKKKLAKISLKTKNSVN